ncbi:MAG: hypothetical protein AB7P37_21665, partial [Ramlibacter sp.]
TTDHQEGEGDQELIHNVSVKFTNQGGSRFDGNGGSALHGNQQLIQQRIRISLNFDRPSGPVLGNN